MYETLVRSAVRPARLLAPATLSAWTLLAALAAPPVAQAIDSTGTEFLLAFPETVPGQLDRVQTLLITSSVATSGSVSNSALGINLPFATGPGTAALVTLPASAQLETSDAVESRGILVTAADPVAVYGFNRRPFTTDGFLGLPTSALGTSYIVTSWPFGLGKGSQLAVVGTVDGTSVTVTPSITVGPHPAGVPFVVALDRGDTYYLAAGPAVDQDLTGSRIAADQPVAVFGSHTCAEVPVDGTASCDFAAEQMLPVSSWGVEYFAVPFAGRTSGYVLRVLAATGGTAVYFDGAQVATLAAGEHFDATLTAATRITTSAPTLVSQLANGGSADGEGESFGDPFLALVPPTSLYRTAYAFAVPDFAVPDDWTHSLNLVVPAEAVGQVTLDGAAVPAGSFAPIGDSGYAAAQIETSPGGHELASAWPFTATVYGQAGGDAYGYPAGTDFFRAPSLVAIPTLSTWGLAGLAALLGAGGLVAVRRLRAARA